MVTNEDMDWVIKNFLKRKDYTYDFMYVPHDASRTTAADKRKSTSILLRNHKYKVKRVKKPGNNKLDSEISLVKTNIRRCSFDSEKCAKGLDHLTLYQQQWNDNVGMFMGTPRHDIHSHPADSFRTLIMGAREHIKKTGNTATSVQTVHQYDPYGAPAKVVVEDYNPFNI